MVGEMNEEMMTNNPYDALTAAIQAAGSQSLFARQHGFSSAFIGQVVMGRARMSERLAEALGFERVCQWVEVEKQKANE